ncbi:MAG: four helix bundle suffix domain-containing protein [Muribaculaceae bacterium]|nr:four helix bundle suffix domain-containing protein [Muribaculaceae bacterium]
MSGFLKISGDYSRWNVYKKSVIICDVTEMFIRANFDSKCRTVDQMRQAARSCKQNIVEGASDNTVSAEMCIKLIGVAKSSLRELLEDYGDFLRQNGLQTWPLEDERTRATRRFCSHHHDPVLFVEKCRLRTAETVANIMLTQIRQLDSLLARELKDLERDFLAGGGIREKMTASRRSHRGY